MSEAVVEQVVFRLQEELYGLPAVMVEQMIELPDITMVPNTPSWCRGVTNLRGRVVPVYDLRVLLGKAALTDELASMNLPQRWQDHQKWVAELESSVAEGRKFPLTTDPHKCKFGLWYDAFKPHDPWLAAALSAFDAPHKRLHATADVVEAHIEAGRKDLALAVIEELHQGALAELRALFAQTIESLPTHYRESALVVRRREELVAFSTDQIMAVETLDRVVDSCESDLPAETRTYITGFARRPGDGGLVMLMDSSPESRLLAV